MTSNFRRTWPFVVLGALTLAFENGWSPKEIRDLAAVLLVLVALIYAAGGGGTGGS